MEILLFIILIALPAAIAGAVEGPRLKRWLKGGSALVALLFALYIVTGFVKSGRDEARRTALESSLRSSLAVGDPAEKIERVLKEKTDGCTYARMLQRFESIVRFDRYSALVIYIHVDPERRMKSIETHLSY